MSESLQGANKGDGAMLDLPRILIEGALLSAVFLTVLLLRFISMEMKLRFGALFICMAGLRVAMTYI